jgi:hypothetical protein
MSGPFAASPHHARGSRAPRLAGVAAAVIVAAGVLAFYLSGAHAPHQAGHSGRHLTLSVKVVAVQTVGVIDPDDDPLMLADRDKSVDFLTIPSGELSAGTPEWTADQMSDGTEIFIYVPDGKCLTALGIQRVRLTHCDLGPAQRWQPVNSRVVRGQAIAQYANAWTGGCLTARSPGPALLTPCGSARTNTQEIAFWWNA